MHKPYLLLRNNKQSGPYSLEEILQKGLKAFDLIWIDGKSAGWRYPSEIDSLKAYVEDPTILETATVSLAGAFADTNQEKKIQFSPGGENNKSSQSSNPSKKIFVSLPLGKNIRLKQPETNSGNLQNHSTDFSSFREKENERLDVSADNIPVPPPIRPDKVKPEVNYARSLNDVEQDYTNWVFKQKSKSRSISGEQLKGIGTVVVFLAIVFFGVSRLLSENKADSGETALSSPPVPTANKVGTQDSRLAITAAHTAIKTEHTISVNQLSKNPLIIKKLTAVVKKPGKKNYGPAVNRTNPRSEYVPAEEQHMNTIDNIKKTGDNKTAVVNEKPKENNKNALTEQPKRKKLKEVINSVFAKLKKKNEEPIIADKTPDRIPREMPGDRKSVHRDDDNISHNSVTPEIQKQEEEPSPDLIDITGNETSNKWQLGIYDFRVTLHNHNPVPVKFATVDVLYYDEQDRLLDKKTINFSNVPARGSVTVKAPDHRFADHAAFAIR